MNKIVKYFKKDNETEEIWDTFRYKEQLREANQYTMYKFKRYEMVLLSLRSTVRFGFVSSPVSYILSLIFLLRTIRMSNLLRVPLMQRKSKSGIACFEEVVISINKRKCMNLVKAFT